MKKEKNKLLEKPLRIISPDLYNFIISEFKNYNIHSYDLLVNGTKKEKGIEITLRFGERFDRKQTKLFTFKTLEERDDELTEFIKDTVEICKKAMIDDYFERMAP